MDAAAVSQLKPAASELLLEHCHALDIDSRSRPTAADRLEALIGKDLAGRLVSALWPPAEFCGSSRRRESSPRRRTKRKIAPRGDEREDQRGGARDVECQHADPEQQEEEEGPPEGLNALIDARQAQVHDRDPSRNDDPSQDDR